jgi:uncharacterized protein (TIGR03435 family)
MKTALLTFLAAATAFAQPGQPTCAVVSPTAAKLQFDAASVKPAGPYTRGPFGGVAGGPGTNDPGRITATRVPLANLLMTAYDLWTDQVSGPDWMKDAINNGFAITATMPAATTKEEYCGMLRNLLTERFHLTLRREMQARPGFELTVLPGGPKFKKYDPQDPGPEAMPGTRSDKNGFPLLTPTQATALSFSVRSDGLTKESFRNDMALFARGLGNAINQSNGLGSGAPLPRVVDKTGLTGVYDIRFEYVGTPMNLAQPRDPGAGPAAAPDPADVGPNIFSAVQQLGLKLQKVKDIQVEVLIVEHADQTPAEN